MFRRPFKVKSKGQLKASERKQFRDVIINKFPALTESDVDLMLPKKDVLTCTKIETHSGKVVKLYAIQRKPIFFLYEGVYAPTVYQLWQFPQTIATTFTTNEYVIKKIFHGADLMTPGVINKPESYAAFLSNEIAFTNMDMNKAAMAVGVTAMSSQEMMQQHSGKCLLIWHYYGDNLCTFDDQPLQVLPQLGLVTGKLEVTSREDFPALPSGNKEVEVDEDLEESSNENPSPEPSCSNKEINETDDMDKLLFTSFMTAIKYSKTLELPMLTSSFYRLQVIPACPAGKSLEIKKSTYKKVGVFLKTMEKEGLIVIKEKKKGVETIESINTENPTYLSFYVEIGNRPKKEEVGDAVDATEIIESYSVTAAVLPIFESAGFKKQSKLQVGAIREVVTSYVKHHNLQDENNKKFIKISGTIFAALLKNETAVTWEDLMTNVLAGMKPCYSIQTAQAETSGKGNIPPIVMSVQKRSGNKKVTLVDNLELYNIRMSEFAKECQHGVAASTSISKPPGKKCDQILIQGNQVLFIYNLLIDKYKIPKRYIRGLEHAPKTKK